MIQSTFREIPESELDPDALQVALYQIATVFYDFRVHEVAQERIVRIMEQLDRNIKA